MHLAIAVGDDEIADGLQTAGAMNRLAPISTARRRRCEIAPRDYSAAAARRFVAAASLPSGNIQAPASASVASTAIVTKSQ